jgi:hypothetical protein
LAAFDEISIYNRALSSSEVAAIYTVGSAGKCKLNFGPPGILLQPQSLTVTQGQAAAFSVAANGGSPLAYQWRFQGASLTGAISNSFPLAAAFTTNEGSYDVVVTNTWGSVTSAVAKLAVVVRSRAVIVCLRLPAWWAGGLATGMRRTFKGTITAC